MKKALVACLPDPSGNPRPNRLIKLLSKMGYEVHTLSPRLKTDMVEVAKTHEINPQSSSLFFKIIRRSLFFINNIAGIVELNTAFFEKTYSIIWCLAKHKRILNDEKFQIIISEDLTLLPFLLRYAPTESKIVLDAREYYTREMEGSLYFRYLIAPEKKHLCIQLLNKLNGFYTVSDGLAENFELEFGIKPKVIRSIPDFQNTNFNPIKAYPIKLVHHGVANRDRCLENMIYVINALEGKYTLDFYLTGDKKYITELKAIANNSNYFKFNEPVPFIEINKMLSKYHVGFYFLVPLGFNTTYNLPNKFFEFVQAGLGVIIGPSPEMTQLVKKYSIGIVSGYFTVESLVNMLKQVNIDDLNQIKLNSIHASKELSWQEESKKLEGLINEIVSS